MLLCTKLFKDGRAARRAVQATSGKKFFYFHKSPTTSQQIYVMMKTNTSINKLQ